jgi:hypothetical protein
MLILQDCVWNRVTINRAAKKTTWFYVDEFHLLLKEEQTAAYSIEIWKRFRKWGGIPTGITQNVKDLLASREIENIFEKLCCKGWMSSPLLKQQGSRPIRSRMTRQRRKGMITGQTSDGASNLIQAAVFQPKLRQREYGMIFAVLFFGHFTTGRAQRSTAFSDMTRYHLARFGRPQTRINRAFQNGIFR